MVCHATSCYFTVDGGLGLLDLISKGEDEIETRKALLSPTLRVSLSISLCVHLCLSLCLSLIVVVVVTAFPRLAFLAWSLFIGSSGGDNDNNDDGGVDDGGTCGVHMCSKHSKWKSFHNSM